MMREAYERDSAIESAAESARRSDGNGGNQGPDALQLDLYSDLATGKIAVEWTGGDEAV
jgi:hypothetical protein